jgi:hypothetical protein
VPAGGFVTAATVSVAAVRFGSAQEAPESVTVATFVVPEPVALHETKPALSVIVGEVGTVVPLGSLTVIVSPAARAPVALEVKLDVTSAVAPAERVL